MSDEVTKGVIYTPGTPEAEELKRKAHEGQRYCGQVVIELWETPNGEAVKDSITIGWGASTEEDNKTILPRVLKAFTKRVEEIEKRTQS